jgi:hypothetical protein
MSLFFFFLGKLFQQLILNDIGRNCLLEHRKKIVKFSMRTFTYRSTFIYGVNPLVFDHPVCFTPSFLFTILPLTRFSTLPLSPFFFITPPFSPFLFTTLPLSVPFFCSILFPAFPSFYFTLPLSPFLLITPPFFTLTLSVSYFALFYFYSFLLFHFTLPLYSLSSLPSSSSQPFLFPSFLLGTLPLSILPSRNPSSFHASFSEPFLFPPLLFSLFLVHPSSIPPSLFKPFLFPFFHFSTLPLYTLPL